MGGGRADPADVVPGGPGRSVVRATGAPSELLERLRLVPDQLKVKLKCAALTTAAQALAIIKSHYPGVDLKCFEEGYTIDVDEAKLEAFSVEVEPTAECLVDMLDLEDL